MTVKMVGNDAKVEMYIDHKDMGSTLTEIGKEYGVSRKTVSRCIDEVEAMISEIKANIGKELPYQNLEEEISKVRIISIDDPVTDELPVYGREENKDYSDWLYLAGFMSAKEAVADQNTETQNQEELEESEKIQVGSRVQLRKDSAYYDRGRWNPDDTVKGTVSWVHKNSEFCYRVQWDNGTENDYRKGDLKLVVEKDEDAQKIDNAEYMVTAPQDSITIVRIDGSTGKVTQRQTNKHREGFKALREMLKKDLSQETLYRIYCELDTAHMLETYSVGRVKVDLKNESVVFVRQTDGHERQVPDDIASDIIGTVQKYGRKQGEKLVKFLDKLMDNVSFKAIEGLYRFMKHNSIEINEDGSIKAWKGVRTDLHSIHAGSIKNSPTCPVREDGRIDNSNFGEEIRVDRNEVNDDPDVTCSYGLHVGSLDYAKGFGDKVIEVKVEPQDVVAVPKDYDGAKMRCCAYTPIREI